MEVKLGEEPGRKLPDLISSIPQYKDDGADIEFFGDSELIPQQRKARVSFMVDDLRTLSAET